MIKLKHKIIVALVFIRLIDANYYLLDYRGDQKRIHCADSNSGSLLHKDCVSFLCIKQ
jgi:hypothetical protein